MSLLLSLSLATVVATAPSVEGHWEGKVSCPPPSSAPEQPPNIFTIHVLMAPGPQGLQGFMSSPRPGISAELKSVTVNEAQLRVTASVPQHYQVVLAGALDGATWSATLTQGPLSCPAKFQRLSDLQLKTLPIAPRAQAQPHWSWITVGEMVFRHYGVVVAKDTVDSSAQCHIVRALFSGSEQFQCQSNCSPCESMSGGSSVEVAGMLTSVPRRLAASGRPVPRLYAAGAPVLPASQMIQELEQGNPIVVGLSPGAPSALPASLHRFLPPMHAALVTGYLKSSAETWYLVNDPYPFRDPLTNPYVQQQSVPVMGLLQGAPIPVAYWIRESALKAGLQWSESFLLSAEQEPRERKERNSKELP
ncbi:hypothetical protein [Hyalangium gracile]|uniref:hypothetical protein n=1 Tax=Hyalangium gracile TaxID=394092 RepID=UPI001CD03142|nr:hypothetical protein [Hyalangium gracile]